MLSSVYVFVLFILRTTGKIEEEKEPYKNIVKKICRVLGFICVITLLLWFLNIRNINDVKMINTQCKTIEQDNETVTMVCPLNKEEEKEK